MSVPWFGRRLTAEFLGTATLLATVIGSGIMGERLAAGNGDEVVDTALSKADAAMSNAKSKDR
jgi:hypothetical protein